MKNPNSVEENVKFMSSVFTAPSLTLFSLRKLKSIDSLKKSKSYIFFYVFSVLLNYPNTVNLP